MSLVLSTAQMRAVDGAAIDTLGMPGVVLMENAGRGVAQIVRRECPRLGQVRVVCGAGQNGGDGFVIARHLANAGARVTVLLAAPRAKITGDATVFLSIIERMGLTIHEGGDWARLLEGADVIVDALFGTGLRADVTGTAATAIEAMNASSALRVAVDLPSGLDADSGAVRGVAVRADITATMAALKLGLVLDAEAPVGRVEVVDIGIAVPALVQGPLCHWIEAHELAPLLPRRSVSGHKGTAGHVLVIAGSPGKTGAAVLAARGAHRAGAGLVTVASTAAGQIALDAKVVETMTVSYAEGEDADAGSYDRIAAIASKMKAVAIGPGIPDGPGMRALVARVVAELPLPVVVDADGLNLLGADVAVVVGRAPAPRVLTPHPGEMARLTGVSTVEVQRERLRHARELARSCGAVVVLKGARTIIAAPDGTAHINPAANSALGTAGSGDVLTGVIAALCGQGLHAVDAARIGVHAHGLAADDAIAVVGTQHLIAGDLPEAVARVLDRQLERGRRDLEPAGR